MKTIKIAAAMIMIIIMSAADVHGQNNLVDEDEDSVINCIAYFEKGDTMRYVVKNRKLKIGLNADTIYTENNNVGIQLAVVDSTDVGYIIEMRYTSFDDYLDNDSTIDAVMQKAIAPSAMKMHVLFSTDEFGEVKRIENWKELRDSLKQCYAIAADSLYSHDVSGEFAKVLSKDEFKSSLNLSLTNEPDIHANFDEIDNLFTNHGMSFTIGQRKNDESPSGYATENVTTATYTQVEDSTWDFDGDYEILFTTTVTLPGKDIKDFAKSFVKLLSDSINKDSVDIYIEQLTRNDIRIKSMEDCTYFPNGWPKMVTNVKTELYGDGTASKIELQQIECIYRSFGKSSHEADNPKEGKQL